MAWDWDDNEPRSDRKRDRDGDNKREPINFRAIQWRRLIGFLKPYRGRMVIALIGLLFAGGVNAAFPLLIRDLLAIVQPGGDFAPLNSLTLALVGLFFLQAAFTFVQSFNLAYIGERIVLDLRKMLYGHLHALSLDFYAERRVGELVSRLSSDVTQVRTMLTGSVTQLLSQLLSLILSVAVVFALNPRLTLFILFLMPALVIFAVVFGRPFGRLSTRVTDELASSTTAAEEGLQGIRIVKSFAREQYEVGRYNSAMERTLKATMRLAIYRSLFGSVMAFFGFSAVAAILWFGGREVIEGRLTLADITAFLIYAINIAASLGGLASLYGQFREAIGGIQRVFEILDTKPTITDAPNAKALQTVEGRVKLDKVSFSYDTRAAVLHGIDLDIRAGEIIALVGPSGAGKSTVFNLIPRFYDPTNGTVSIDGNDLRGVTMNSLREQIGIVPQETMLFGGTIRENIQYGRLDATEAEIIEAAKAANAHEFIMALPDQYNAIVGERGVKLSGGQRQRIAIARAILKNPRVLLLDEATSALDSESEELVQDALNRLMQNRTTVIIAHRLSTIKIAHRIIVLDAGRIVEQGTHDELMTLNGLYARLYNMQFREQEPQPEKPAA